MLGEVRDTQAAGPIGDLPRTPFISRLRFGRVPSLTLILLAAILLRLPVALYSGDRVAEMPGIHDQISYDALALSLLAGRGHSFTEDWYPFTPANTPTAHWSFVYPLYLAGVYSQVGYHPLVARLLQVVLGGSLICLLLHRIGRRVADERTGLAAAALAAGYGFFIYYNAALMTETFFIVFVLISLSLSLELAETPTPVRWTGLGLALGMAALLRQTALIVAPVLLLWLMWALRGRAMPRWHVALPVVAIAAMVLPWSLRNQRVYGQFLLLNSNAGYAFFASNHPHLGTDWRNEGIAVPVPPDLAGRNEAELDRALLRLGIGFIAADPGRYVRLTLDKTLEYFKFWPSAESGPISNLNRMLSFGLFLPFMLWGLGLSFSRWRRFMPLYLFAAIHTVVHLLSWPAPRYRLPVDAVFMVFAGMAVLELVRRVAAWRGRLAPAHAG